MKITLLQNRYEKNILPATDIDNRTFNEMFYPEYNISKDKLALFNCCEREDSTQLVREGLKYKYIHALILDYDKGYPIEDFIKTYKFRFYLYTTATHTRDFPKFRVIIPLKTPTDYSIYQMPIIHSALHKYFPYLDNTNFDTNRYFNVPTLTEDFYNYKNLSNELFSFSYLESILEDIQIQEANRKNYENMFKVAPVICSTIDWSKAEDELNDILRHPGGRYAKVLSWSGKYKSLAYKLDDREETVNDILLRSDYKHRKTIAKGSKAYKGI